MEKNSHTFLHALKLWLIWNVLADLSTVIFIMGGWQAIEYFVTPLFGYGPIVVIFSILLFILVVVGLIVGLIQWIAFESRIKHSYLWILATSLGWSMAGLGWFVAYIEVPSLGFFGITINSNRGISIILIGMGFLVGAIGGAVIGLLQWLVLQRQVVGAELWLECSILGWTCAACAAYVLGQTSLGTVGALVGLSFMGMITGIAYAYLFTQSSHKNEGLKNEQYHTRSATVGQ